MNINDKSQNQENISAFETKKGTINDLKEEDDFQEDIEINNKIRNTLFVLICLEYGISCWDAGIIPQQVKNLHKDFNDIGDSRFGLFGSIDFIGRIIGAAFMAFLINKINRKILFSSCCFFKGITLIISLFSGNYILNLITRLISGIPQTLLTSYGTIWTDQYGKKKRRTMMLPILQLSTILGLIMGYGLAILSEFILGDSEFHSWRLSFVIEGVALVVFGIIFLFYPNLYFSTSFYLKEDDDNKGREKSVQEIAKERYQNNFSNFLKQIPQILCLKIFMLISIGNTVAFLCMRIIQFYADLYMEKVLDVTGSVKNTLYIVLSLSGPISGVIICGAICSKIGGYATKKGMIFIIIINILGCISSHFISLTLNSFVSLSACWIFLFFYAGVTPLQNGVIIASLPKKLKGNGYSINIFLLNLLGSFPSSYVFGLISDGLQKHYPDEGVKYRKTMMISMLYNYVGLILIIFGGIIRLRLSRELENNEEENGKQFENNEGLGVN